MARVKGALMTRKRRKATLKAAKGYWGAKSKHFKMAKQAVLKSGNYAFAGRKMKKRDVRSLWITRISAQAKVCGMNYSHLCTVLSLQVSILTVRCLQRLQFPIRTHSQQFARRLRLHFNKIPGFPSLR